MTAVAKQSAHTVSVAKTTQTGPELPFAIRHFRLVLLGGVLLLLFMLFLHIYIGTVQVSPLDVVKVLTGQQVDKLTHTVIWELRLPRALVAILAGAMLSLAGAILQSVTRNPLAEPDLTGASAGGVFLAVLYLSRDKVGWDFAPGGIELPFVALVGCIAAGGLVYSISWGKRGQGQGHSNPVRLVLTGVLVSTILRSLTSLLLLVNQNASGSILMWIIGSLNGRTWQQWQMLWPWAVVTIPVGLLCAGMANTIQLGDETATSLGMRIEWGRAGMLFSAILLTAGAVSAVGA
ncbi:MAG: iron ABC transporter permease, partial [Chloroflexota bacterium]